MDPDTGATATNTFLLGTKSSGLVTTLWTRFLSVLNFKVKSSSKVPHIG